MRIPLGRLLGGRSPLPRAGRLMTRVTECTDRVPELIERLLEGDQEKVVALAKEISRLEGKADETKNDIRAHLPAKLFLPVDRRDVLRLIGQIDAIADCAEDVAVLLTWRPMETPEPLRPLLRIYVERVLDTVATAKELVDLLDPLMEVGFGGKVVDRIGQQIDEVARKEHEADKVQDQICKTLFSLENELPPVGVFMWTKVLFAIGDMANHAENVGDAVRLIVAR
ncbi:MAG: TIGR00153 family protein [Planctomycetota bacterium]